MKSVDRLIRLRRLSRRLLASVAVIVTTIPALATAQEEANVAVGLRSGKVFVGRVDSRSDERQLWLCAGREGIELRRPIDWQSIVLVRSGDRELTSADFRTQVLSAEKTGDSHPTGILGVLPVRSTQPRDLGQAPTMRAPEAIAASRPTQWLPDHRLSQFIRAARANNTQVCSLAIDAQVANLNRTAEADGLVLHIYPLDGAGNMIAVDGTLDVELVASVPPGWPRGEPLPVIGHWAVRLFPQQFGPAGAIVKLPFQGVHPEFDLNIGPYGLVHTRLSIPGNGSYEASQAVLRIRPYSMIRDQSQLIDGQRFFDVERVDRRGW